MISEIRMHILKHNSMNFSNNLEETALKKTHVKLKHASKKPTPNPSWPNRVYWTIFDPQVDQVDKIACFIGCVCVCDAFVLLTQTHSPPTKFSMESNMLHPFFIAARLDGGSILHGKTCILNGENLQKTQEK